MATVTISPSGQNPVLKAGYTTTHTGWSGNTALYKVTLQVEPIESLPDYNSPFYGFWIELSVSGREAVRYKENSPNSWSTALTSPNGYWTSVPSGTACYFGTNCSGWSKNFSISYSSVAQYTVSYNANQGSGAPGNQTKYNLKDLTLSSTKPTRTNYKFVNWNTKADGSGTSYSSGSTYSGNADLTLYAQWEIVGPSVVLDANIYYNEDYLNNDSYTANNYKFPGSGDKASWTKFTSDAKYNTHPTEYRTGKKVYFPNSNNAGFAIRGTPYTHKGHFDVEFCGYYTGSTWADPGIKVYEPNFSWLYKDNRNYMVVAIPNTEYFGAATTVSNSDWGDTFYGPATGSEYDSTSSSALEKIRDDSLYVPKIDTSVVLNNQNKFDLPPWLKSGNNTYVFYALWSKPNLTFTYHTNYGTDSTYIHEIGTPGVNNPSFSIKSFADTELSRRWGYDFSAWNTAADGSGNNIILQTIDLGGYLNDVDLYAQWTQRQNSVEFYLTENDETATESIQYLGGQTYTVTIPINPEDNSLKFLGYFSSDGLQAFDRRGNSVNGQFFRSGVWDCPIRDTIKLYARWGSPTNAYIYDENNTEEPWQQAYIFINKSWPNNPQNDDWEQVDMADFL